jgi:hypothetical protein
VDGDARVTTAIVGLLIAFCALLLFKWLALVALAAVVLVAVLRFALRRAVHAVRGRRSADADPGTVGATPAVPSAPATAPVLPLVPAPDCSWCGLLGGHRDLRGHPVRPRHAHALPAPSRYAS